MEIWILSLVAAGQLRRGAPARTLGATGLVGQRLVKLIADHPWFEVTELVASERSAGRPYRDAAHWLQSSPVRCSHVGWPINSANHQ